MRPLTIRTISQRREDKEMRKPEPPPAAEDTLRGKRVRLSSKHPAYYYYNKSARGKWNRASQVVEGMRWNAYKSSGKETPLPCPLHVPEFAPMMGGRMREAMGEGRAGHAEAPRKKEREASRGMPQAARAMDARAQETQAHHDYHDYHEKAAGMAQDSASVQRFQEPAYNPRLEHDLALHEGIQAGGRGGENEAAGNEDARHAPAPEPKAQTEAGARPCWHAPTLQAAAGGHVPFIPSSHVQAEGPHESRPAPDQQSLTAHLPPMPSGSAPLAPAISHAPHSIRAREWHAAAGAAAQATRSEIVHPAEAPGAPAIAVHDVRITRGPGWISSAAKKVVQLKVARADAQPPGDI